VTPITLLICDQQDILGKISKHRVHMDAFGAGDEDNAELRKLFAEVVSQDEVSI